MKLFIIGLFSGIISGMGIGGGVFPVDTGGCADVYVGVLNFSFVGAGGTGGGDGGVEPV